MLKIFSMFTIIGFLTEEGLINQSMASNHSSSKCGEYINLIEEMSHLTSEMEALTHEMNLLARKAREKQQTMQNVTRKMDQIREKMKEMQKKCCPETQESSIQTEPLQTHEIDIQTDSPKNSDTGTQTRPKTKPSNEIIGRGNIFENSHQDNSGGKKGRPHEPTNSGNYY